SSLAISHVVKDFGGVRAVNDVSLTVESGEKYAIIGPNGAGKSTLFNLIAGQLPVSSGQIVLGGRDITRLNVQQCANLGIGRTFQRNNLFLGMSVLENVRLAVQHQQRIASSWFRPITSYDELYAKTEALLKRVGLLAEKERKVSELAYGQQRAVEVALALALEPKILLLDEPTAGMSPAETAEIVDLIKRLPPTLTMMIVEHDMDVIFSLADRITVLHYGQVITTGTPQEVHDDALVQEIYLGG
ncbi:MAG: ABC transporter ATP-binding protein, partial [Anaerolineales bacterium]|nr:ABC transporter ATP-binding protein [Anaerolineales bacterium]